MNASVNWRATMQHLQPRRHPRSAIQANDTPIQHRILHTRPRQRRKLSRRARALGELHGALEALAHLIGGVAGHGGLEDARGDGDDANSKARQVAGHGQRHAGDGALCRCVGGLAHLAVKSSGRRDHEDDAVLGVALGGGRGGGGGEVWEELADEVEFAAEVDGEDKVEGGEREGAGFTVEDLCFFLYGQSVSGLFVLKCCG